jgi:hypothetical protein
MASDGSVKTEVYQASLEEMARLSLRTAEEIAAANTRYEHIVASANGGVLLGLCIGEALDIQVQTLRVVQFTDNGGIGMPIVLPLDVIREKSNSVLLATECIDKEQLDLFGAVLPGAQIAANYSLLDETETSENVAYCGKVVLPQQAGNKVQIQFWYSSASRD